MNSGIPWIANRVQVNVNLKWKRVAVLPPAFEQYAIPWSGSTRRVPQVPVLHLGSPDLSLDRSSFRACLPQAGGTR